MPYAMHNCRMTHQWIKTIELIKTIANAWIWLLSFRHETRQLAHSPRERNSPSTGTHGFFPRSFGDAPFNPAGLVNRSDLSAVDAPLRLLPAL